jgi:hypothetical protein
MLLSIASTGFLEILDGVQGLAPVPTVEIDWAIDDQGHS